MVELKLFAQEIAGLEEAIACVAKVRGFALSGNGTPIHILKGSDGFSVAGNGEYTVTYSMRNELFRALALLVGNLEQGVTEIHIKQKNHFDMCGVMIDCSRNAVAMVETLTDLLARMALMGLNTAMLYTEDTYEVEGYEYFGYMRGRYSENELRELDTKAASFGIELIPCIQTLAHLTATLRWDYAKDMKDNGDILLVGEEKTYEFVEAMIRSVRKCFSTKRIHIGMDEAHDVGRGKYLDRYGYRDRFEILCEHVTKVCAIAEKYDFKPMMWSDMFFRIGSDDGEYYNKDAKMPRWLPDKIPEQLSMVYWDYYHYDSDFYDGMINGHKQMEREIIFAGGIWKWSGMSPAYKLTFNTSIPALTACVKAGIRNVFATMWGDDGGEISNYTTLLGMQLYAEFGFSEEFNVGSLYESFKLCTGYDAESFLALSTGELERDRVIAVGTGVSRQVLYQDILCGLYDKNFACFDLESFYEDKEKHLDKVKVPVGLEYMFDYNKALLKVLKTKSTIGMRIRKAYQNENKADMAECIIILDSLLADVEELHNKAYIMWHTENKPFGFDMFDVRLSGVAARIKTAKRRILEWLDGETEAIEELEEKLLWYGSEATEGKIPSKHCYNDIASVSIIR